MTLAGRDTGTGAMRAWLAAALAALTLVWCVEAPVRPAHAQAPPKGFDLKASASIAEGRSLYNLKCAGRCHGVDGQDGFDGPILIGKVHLEPSYVWATLTTGRPGSAMPSWNGRLSDHELWTIIAFVASLGDRARAARGR